MIGSKETKMAELVELVEVAEVNAMLDIPQETTEEELLGEYFRLRMWCEACLGHDVAMWNGLHVDS
jgi:hypothetical protein